MRVEKKSLNEALRILGKVVCQTSPVELYRAIRFAGDLDEVRAMATDGKEVVSVVINAMPEADVDFCVPYKDLKELVRISRNETLELTGKRLSLRKLKAFRRMPKPSVLMQIFVSIWRRRLQSSTATNTGWFCRASIFQILALQRRTVSNC